MKFRAGEQKYRVIYGNGTFWMSSKHVSVTDICIILLGIAINWLPGDLTDDESALIRVMTKKHGVDIAGSQRPLP